MGVAGCDRRIVGRSGIDADTFLAVQFGQQKAPILARYGYQRGAR